jgi:hypothetical protein
MARIRKADPNPAPEVLIPVPDPLAAPANHETPEAPAPAPEIPAPPRRGRPPGSVTKKREPEPPAVKIGPEILGKLFVALGTVEARLLAGRMGVPLQIAERSFIPEDPLLSMLSDSAAAVLAKYNIGGRYADEIVLASMLVLWQTTALQNIRSYQQTMKGFSDASRDSVGKAASGEVNPSPGSGD